MNSNTPGRIQDDDFDIELLAWKLYRLAGKVVSMLLYPVRLLFYKPLRLLVLTIAALACAVALRYTLPKTYRSEFIIKPSMVGESYYLGLVHDLGMIVKDNDEEMLVRELHITANMAREVRKIDFIPIRQHKNTDSIEALTIILMTTDRSAFDTLQQRILQYLENNVYYAKIRENHRVE